jgi:hypothetical protein
VWNWICPLIGLALGLFTAVQGFFAFMFRFDTRDEYEFILEFDIYVGAALAASLLLVAAPVLATGSRARRAAVVAVALAAGTVVASGLRSHHERGHRIRSGATAAAVHES